METAPLLEHDGWQSLGGIVASVVSGLYKMREGERRADALKSCGWKAAQRTRAEGGPAVRNRAGGELR